MKLIIDSVAGFELEDTDTGETFQFSGKLAKLQEVVNNSVTEETRLLAGLAGGQLYVNELKVG